MSTNIKVSLAAVLNDDGSVSCDLVCAGQEARVTFTGTDVVLDVREPAAQEGAETPVSPEEREGFVPAGWPDLKPRP